MHAGSCESTREAFEWHEAKPSASQVLSQFPKCIHNSIDAQLKHGPFLLEHCHFKHKQIKYRILLNHTEHFDWLNAIMRFDRHTGVHLSRFRCTLDTIQKACEKLPAMFEMNIKLCCSLSLYVFADAPTPFHSHHVFVLKSNLFKSYLMFVAVELPWLLSLEYLRGYWA